MKPSVLAVAVATFAFPASGHADNWIVGEVPAAVAVGGVQEDVYRPGMMPAVGVYHERGAIAVGLRMRLGALGDGPPPMPGLKIPGMGGLATLGAALRAAHGPAWVEGVVGAGMTGADWVPAVEVGAGWTFATGALDIGPSVRWLRVGSRDQMDSIGAANVVLVGVDARFGRDRAPRRIAYVAAAEVPPPPPPPEVFVADADGDDIADSDLGCDADAEGCPVAGELVLHDDRIVLDSRVLFETDRAHVRSSGREMVRAIAEAWRVHPEWKRMTVEGHADVRGTDAYNEELSQRRADNVKAQLVKNGFAADRIDAVGYGRSRPRDPGDTEAAHSRNRRVEFVIDRTAPPSDGAARSEAGPVDRTGVPAEVTP